MTAAVRAASERWAAASDGLDTDGLDTAPERPTVFTLIFLAVGGRPR